MKEELIQMIHPLVASCLRKYAAGKDEVQDLYNAGIAFALECMEQYDTTRGVTVCAFLRPRLQGFYRNYGRRKQLEVCSLDAGIEGNDDGLLLAEVIADDRCDIEGDLIHREDLERLRKVLATLPVADRDFLWRIYGERASFRAIGAEQKVSSMTVYRRHRALLLQMREILEEE